MEFAIIKTGGKQYKVVEGKTITIEKIEGVPAQSGSPKSSVAFHDVLLVSDAKGVRIGTPHVAGAKVEGEFLENKKGEKVIVFRYKPKKRVRVKKGHRQIHSLVKITSIKG